MPVLQKKHYELIEAGLYAGKVTAITVEEGQFGEQAKIALELDGGYPIMAWAKATLSDKSKLGRWVQALTGEIPEELDTDHLLGLRCLVHVVVKDKPDGTQFNSISELLPAEKRSVAAFKPKPVAIVQGDVEPDEEEVPF